MTAFVEEEREVLEDKAKILDNLRFSHASFDLDANIRTVNGVSESNGNSEARVVGSTFIDGRRGEEGIVKMPERCDVFSRSQRLEILRRDLGESYAIISTDETGQSRGENTIPFLGAFELFETS